MMLFLRQYVCYSLLLLLALAPTARSLSIHDAVVENDVEAIREAIAVHGEDINTIGTGGQTPLVSAVLKGKLEAVKVLLELGADVTIPEKDGYTVMHAAAFQGRARILQVLAAHKNADGSKIELMHRHKDGYYPFHRACWGRQPRHAETVNVFLSLGVPHDTMSANGQTCIQMTRNEETLSYLMNAIQRQGEPSTSTSDTMTEDVKEEL
eukprot:Nitzschia sp. Nitz4//scaffold362_size15054//6449//7075//NITZ4_008900-RA/size15054-processed-gene-0.11-mRNA-1//-1//CDS//3329549244//1006//frame0